MRAAFLGVHDEAVHRAVGGGDVQVVFDHGARYQLARVRPLCDVHGGAGGSPGVEDRGVGVALDDEVGDAVDGRGVVRRGA